MATSPWHNLRYQRTGAIMASYLRLIVLGCITERSFGYHGCETDTCESVTAHSDRHALGSPLFVGKRGPQIRRRLQLIWKSAVIRAGLPEDVSIHCTRHTLAAVHLLRWSGGTFASCRSSRTTAAPITTANMYADVPFEEMLARLNGLYEAGEG